MNNPIISIIIPVYNVEDYLEKSIHSALNQTFTDIEVIAVNDGSQDNSLSILKEITKKDNRLIIIDQENRGVFFARKSAIDIAKGKYLFFLDSDDYIANDIIEHLYNKIIDDSLDIACCNFMTVKGTHSYPNTEKQVNNLDNYKFSEHIISHKIAVSIWGKLYKKELYAKLSYFKEIWLGEDEMTNFEIGLKKPKVGFINNIGVYYYQRSESMSHNKFDLKYVKLYSNRIKEILSKYELPSNEYLAQCKQRWHILYIRKSVNRWMDKYPFIKKLIQTLKGSRNSTKAPSKSNDKVFNTLKPIVKLITSFKN